MPWKHTLGTRPIWKPVFVVYLFIISLLYPTIAWSILLPHDYMGRIVGKEGSKITIQAEFKWFGDQWLQDNSTIAGEAPNQSAVNEIGVNDYVIAESLGHPGGRWVTLIKTIAYETITDLYGDLTPLFYYPPLLGQYTIEVRNTPDCAACSGCNCQTKMTSMTIRDQGGQENSREMNPGDSWEYDGEDHAVYVTFISGETGGYPDCNDRYPCGGPQPISNFVINIRSSAK